MPTYTYRREDGSSFEIEQRITEDALTECPTTGQPVKRIVTGGAGLVFKGSGFYLTDYARKGGNGKAESSSDGGSDAGAKSDSTSAPKSDSASSSKSESGATKSSD